MQIISSSFGHYESIPSKYTCNGANISPPLTIMDVPEGTKSLVLLMDDPDVPHDLRADGMWDHWIIFNMLPNVRMIEEGIEPKGIHGKGTAGNLNYHGPCPPNGKHRYFFKLYALDAMLDLIEGTRKNEVEVAMKGHILTQTELTGFYEQL